MPALTALAFPEADFCGGVASRLTERHFSVTGAPSAPPICSAGRGREASPQDPGLWSAPVNLMRNNHRSLPLAAFGATSVSTRRLASGAAAAPVCAPRAGRSALSSVGGPWAHPFLSQGPHPGRSSSGFMNRSSRIGPGGEGASESRPGARTAAAVAGSEPSTSSDAMRACAQSAAAAEARRRRSRMEPDHGAPRRSR